MNYAGGECTSRPRLYYWVSRAASLVLLVYGFRSLRPAWARRRPATRRRRRATRKASAADSGIRADLKAPGLTLQGGCRTRLWRREVAC